jgi:hypothetical protein
VNWYVRVEKRWLVLLFVLAFSVALQLLIVRYPQIWYKGYPEPCTPDDYRDPPAGEAVISEHRSTLIGMYSAQLTSHAVMVLTGALGFLTASYHLLDTRREWPARRFWYGLFFVVVMGILSAFVVYSLMRLIWYGVLLHNVGFIDASRILKCTNPDDVVFQQVHDMAVLMGRLELGDSFEDVFQTFVTYNYSNLNALNVAYSLWVGATISVIVVAAAYWFASPNSDKRKEKSN